MDADIEAKRAPGRGIMLFVFFGVLITLIVIKQAQKPPEERPIETVDLLELKNLGIAYLENDDLTEADLAFERLAELSPEQILGFQNLAITRLLKIDADHISPTQDAELYERELVKTETAVLTLIERFPNTLETHLIAARFAEHLQESDRAVQELSAAAALQPNDAALAFETYETGHESKNPEVLTKAGDGLARAAELAPTNLHVLRTLIEYQARRQDPEIAKSFARARELFAPLAQQILILARQDINNWITQGETAAADGKWDMVERSAMLIGNIVKPQVAVQLDARRVQKHLLDFVAYDFDDSFYESRPRPEVEFEPAIDVTWKHAADVLPDMASVQSVQALDFDLDERLDLVVVSDATLRVFSRDDADAWKTAVELEIPAGTRGACLFDLDRDVVFSADEDVTKNAAAPAEAEARAESSDGNVSAECATADLDVVLYGASGLIVYQNKLDEESGTRSLQPVEQLEEFAAIRDVISVLQADIDHDGDLDLVVSAQSGMSLWLNRDDSTFVDATPYSRLAPPDAGIHTMIPVDWDRNVSLDVVCIGQNTAGVLQNVLHGQLQWQDFDDKAAMLRTARGAALIEADTNFSWDLVAATEKGTVLATTANPDAGVTRFLATRALELSAANGVLVCDVDNDGWTDIVDWGGAEVRVQRGGPQAEFAPQVALTEKFASDIVDCVSADLDADGDLDLAVARADGIDVLWNNGGNENNWIDLPVRADRDRNPQMISARANINGIGSLMELRAGNRYQVQVVTGQSTHFGLGQRERADSVRVVWTNGIPEHIIGPKHAEPLCLQQKLLGSCPYLYTWNGERFVFCTDCLWAAPVGLQLAEGVVAPTREWEYLKIDGDLLAARDGEYVLQMTEELWEIAYIDSVRLLTVDHPADVEIYSNEKVGPPDIAQHRIHTVRNPQTPLSAIDQRGRDVLPSIATRDDRYLACFDRLEKSGLAEPHHLELSLGTLADPQNVTLFMTGWILPTGTSLNVAISQRPDLDSPAPPSVWVPDADGQWVQVRPNIGFPGGKTKTIAIDLSGCFLCDDHRVRVATSMEIYWDHVFFSSGEEPVEHVVSERPLLAADLHYRGFSARIDHPHLGPDSYDYDRVTTDPKWPPMAGRLTAYGSVLELVSTTDNRQALIGSGDELELRFSATDAPPLPDGWKRDFILHNVGWDKDADLNTVFGQTVDPLPFAGMRDYPELNIPQDKPPFANQRRRQSRPRFWRLLGDESATSFSARPSLRTGDR